MATDEHVARWVLGLWEKRRQQDPELVSKLLREVTDRDVELNDVPADAVRELIAGRLRMLAGEEASPLQFMRACKRPIRFPGGVCEDLEAAMLGFLDVFAQVDDDDDEHDPFYGGAMAYLCRCKPDRRMICIYPSKVVRVGRTYVTRTWSITLYK